MQYKLSDFQIDPKTSLPIYAQIRQNVTWMVASGRLKAGDRLPTIRELAKQLGVHMHTVRKAYQILETDGLVETRRRLGTRIIVNTPNYLITKPNKILTHTIGILLPDLTGFFAPFIKGIEMVANSISALIFVTNTHDRPENAQQIVNQLLNKGVDGLILASTGRLENPPEQIPLVYVDTPEALEQDISIGIDSKQALNLATNHLISHGHRRIAYLTAPLEWPNVDNCYQGFLEAVSEAGLSKSEITVLEVPNFNADYAFQEMLIFLQKKPAFTGLVACADTLAIGAMRAIKQIGLRIPEDVAVIGYNNLEIAGMIEPALSSVTLPIFEMGEKAMNSLIELIQNKPVSNQQIILPVELVIRRSCGCNKSN